jgi:cobalt/nickel transport protein
MTRRRTLWFVAGGLLVALLLAGVVSNFASSSPDGLDATTRKGCTTDADGNITGGTCIAQQEEDHQLKDSPLADYGIKGIDNEYLSTGLSGVLGVLVTFGVGAGAFWLVRRRGRPAGSVEPAASAGPAESEPAASGPVASGSAASEPAASGSAAPGVPPGGGD